MVGVTAGEVRKHFLRSPSAQTYFEAWAGDPTRGEVVPRVMAHTSHVLMGIPFEDIEQVGKRSGHALGDIVKGKIKAVPDIANWTTSFAVTHVFSFIEVFSPA